MTEGTPNVEPTPEQLAPEPIQVKLASGEQVTLQAHEMAVLVVLDQRNGSPAVYEVQNCPLRAYSKMLLNEALNLYNVLSVANSTAKVIDELQEKKPKGIFRK